MSLRRKAAAGCRELLREGGGNVEGKTDIAPVWVDEEAAWGGVSRSARISRVFPAVRLAV